MHDAFRDADQCAHALDLTFTGERAFDEALADYHSARDQHVLPFYELTAQIAALEPPPPDLAQLLSAASRSQEAMDDFVRVTAGVTSPAVFFSGDNVSRILGSAAAN
jgi:hypothetical protein